MEDFSFILSINLSKGPLEEVYLKKNIMLHVLITLYKGSHISIRTSKIHKKMTNFHIRGWFIQYHLSKSKVFCSNRENKFIETHK